MGAQNHSNTALPAYAERSSVPPPTRGAENANGCGAAPAGIDAAVPADGAGAVAVGALPDAPQPHNNEAVAVTQRSIRRTEVRVPAIA